MRRWWLPVARGSSGWALALTCSGAFGAAVACSGNSSSQRAPTAGTTSDAGRAGSGATGGTSANGGSSSGGVGGSQGGRSGSSAGGTAAGTSGAGGVSGSSAGGTGGTSGGSAGFAGKDPSPGGEGNEGGHGGASSCQDLCTQGAPECCSAELRCVESVPRCRIDVLTTDVSVIYEYADLEQELATLSPDFLVSITDADIDWAATDPQSSARFELRLTSEASLSHGAALLTMNDNPFYFSCDDRVLFVGVGYMREGAAAIRTPVLHVEESSTGWITLRLGAYQGAWLGLGAGNGDPALRERIDRPELRAALCARGILNEL